MSTNLCRFYLLGNCSKGEKCPYKHEIPKEMPICEFFAQGRCSFGEQCHFRHEGTALKINDLENLEVSPTTSNESEPTGNSDIITINKEDIDDSNKTKLIKTLCPFALSSSCQNIENCRYIHGYPCDICGKLALHPEDDIKQKEHIRMCSGQFERNMEECFRLQMSREIICNICFENVIKDQSKDENDPENDGVIKSVGQARFGLLEGCNHSFCIECIRKWRFKIGSCIPDSVKRACPMCRKFSGFVIPSFVWPENDQAKQQIIDKFKEKVANIPCKYFNTQLSMCPFGSSCFYKHAYPDGSLADRSKPDTTYYDEHGLIINLHVMTISDLIHDLDDI